MKKTIWGLKIIPLTKKPENRAKTKLTLVFALLLYYWLFGVYVLDGEKGKNTQLTIERDNLKTKAGDI